MRKFTIAMLAIAAGLAAQGVAAPSAQAMTPARAAVAGHVSHPGHVIDIGHRGRHFRFNGGMRHHNGIHHGFRRHWGGPRIYLYEGGGGCYWLKKKAMWTGSHYWWRRYWACRNGW